MRVLIVNDYGTPTGGAELSAMTLRECLRARGHDVRFFASSARLLPGVESAADVECFGTTSRLRTIVQTANPLAARSLRRVLAEFRPDVVHVKLFLTQLSPLILRELEGVPCLYHVVWYRPVCPVGTKRLPNGAACTVRAGAACLREGCLPLRDWVPLMWQMREWRRRRGVFRLFVANSETTKRHLEAAEIGPVEVVWNGVPSRPRRAALEGPPVVAFAGRLVAEKGVDVLLRAFARAAGRVPEAGLLVLGEGPERERLSRLADELGVASRVSMPGHVAPAELERRFAGAWAQAVPSLWEEPFGNVAAEALMRGTAVVASDSGGLAEIVRDEETGLLVPPGDVEAWAAALLRLLLDRELSESMGRAARTFALPHFGEDAYADAFVRLYERISRQ